MSEGRDAVLLEALRAAAGASLVDLHADPDHHRSVLTLLGPPHDLLAAVAGIATVALRSIDLSRHVGVHPRIGAIDVVPFAPLREAPLDEAVRARDEAVTELSGLGLPCFRFGPMPDGSMRTLPEVRSGAFATLAPDAGPPTPHPSAGAVAVGARQPLVAWNVWLDGVGIDDTRRLAASVRGPSVRALGLPVSGATQVSCNLLDPARVTPLDVYERVSRDLPEGGSILRCELVGLVPDAVLDAVPRASWAMLDLSEARGIERVLRARRAGSSSGAVS